MDQAVQIAVSLAAIFVIFLIARQMKLGGGVRIETQADARRLADEAISGFTAQDIAIDRAGYGALLESDDGRVLLLRRHGAHFAGRLLDAKVEATLDGRFLMLATSDKRFGTVTFDLGDDAAAWAERLDRL